MTESLDKKQKIRKANFDAAVCFSLMVACLGPAAADIFNIGGFHDYLGKSYAAAFFGSHFGLIFGAFFFIEALPAVLHARKQAS